MTEPLPLPPELSQELTDRLRPDPGESNGTAAPASAPAVETAPSPPRRRRALPAARRLARRLLGRRLSAAISAHLLEPARFVGEGRRRLSAIERELHLLGPRQRDRARQIDAAMIETRAATINLELLKGEVRSVVDALEDLGMAIAPAAGLAGAGVRLSELRERVNGLDRRLRSLACDTQDARQPQEDGAGRPAPASGLFDYVGFERRFRGDPVVISARLAERYLDRLAASPPVVDIGCGNAGLVEMLRKRGIEATGIDTDPSMVAEARAKGLDVRLADGPTFLRSLPAASVGAIVATHVIEHLELAVLVDLLELAATRLRAGGVFIAETPNPASLIVLGNSYILDPTHVRPLHPSLLTFLCEGAGFRDVRLHFYEPARDYQLPLIDDAAAPPWAEQVNGAFRKLNHVLFGPQEYTIVATAAPVLEDEPERG